MDEEKKKKQKLDKFNNNIFRYVYNFFLALINKRYITLTNIHDSEMSTNSKKKKFTKMYQRAKKTYNKRTKKYE